MAKWISMIKNFTNLFDMMCQVDSGSILGLRIECAKSLAVRNFVTYQGCVSRRDYGLDTS